jgi:2-polyprenyl-6-hydroxyphenyl methylase/3-demethylubiquinone-9 3-methyltransferase
MKKVLHAFVQANIWLGQGVDRILPKKFRTDGNKDFLNNYLPSFIKEDLTIYDIGGGKNPCVDQEKKDKLHIRLVGFDIDEHELNLAPAGLYDETICADICTYQGKGDGDLVVMQALLEHVPDVEKALSNLPTFLKPGGRAIIFVPCRTALFARINKALPEKFKRKLLFSLFPSMEEDQGFPAHYDKCTPKQFRAIVTKAGLELEEERLYFLSIYFFFFFPAYIFWRLWGLTIYLFSPTAAAETFIVSPKKPENKRSPVEPVTV